MEKFYKADDDSRLSRDYLKYKENSKLIRGIMRDFLSKHGIESTDFYVAKTTIAIVATAKDREVFENQLRKDSKDGLFFFKVNSTVNRDWIKLVKARGLEFIERPFIWDYFEGFYGGTSSRLFDIEGQVYCSFKGEGNFKPTDNLIEIKASQFFKDVEDYNESLEKSGV